jgi:hypothetical protein
MNINCNHNGHLLLSDIKFDESKGKALFEFICKNCMTDVFIEAEYVQPSSKAKEFGFKKEAPR